MNKRNNTKEGRDIAPLIMAITNHLKKGGKLWELLQKGFHTRINKPGTENEFYTTDELVEAYREYLNTVSAQEAREIHRKQIRALDEIKAIDRLLHLALKGLYEIEQGGL